MCEKPIILLSSNFFRNMHNISEVFVDGVSMSMSDFKDFNAYTYFPKNIDFNEVGHNSYFYVKGTRFRLFNLLPCGRCSSCRESYRRDICNRSIIEACNSGSVYFFTLTYDRFHLPLNGLEKCHVSSAFKRLRTIIDRYFPAIGRFTMIYCGEYGIDSRYTMRPHYHGILYFENDLTYSQKLDLADLFRRRSFFSSVDSDYYSHYGDWGYMG